MAAPSWPRNRGNPHEARHPQRAARRRRPAGPARLPGLPEVPTLIERGMPGTVIGAWFGLGASIATPVPVVALLSQVILAAITSTEAKPRFETLGVDLLTLGPAGFAQFLRESGIRIEF